MCIELPKYVEEPIGEKLRKVMATVVSTLPEKPDEAYVSTSFSRGELNYLGIWLFTPTLAVEIRNPLSQARIQYDMFRFKDAVDWIRLNARRYEFRELLEDSHLELEFTTIDGVSSTLSASGEGCRDLMDIYRRRFLQNFTGTRDAAR